MDATVGERIVIGRGPDCGGRVCEVLEIHEDYGPRRYLVRWVDTGLNGLVVPDGEDKGFATEAA